MNLPGNYTNTTTTLSTSTPHLANWGGQSTNGTTQIIAGPVPRATKARANAGPHHPRKSPKNGRRLALGTLRKESATLPGPTPSDPIGLSVTSGAVRQPNTFDEIREQARKLYMDYLPNVLAYPLRACAALCIEGARAVIDPRAEPPIAPPIAAEATTDLDRVNAGLTAAPQSNTGSLVENAADAFYQVMESEFGSGAADAPTNATQEKIEDAQFKAAIASSRNDPEGIVSRIDYLPPILDIRPHLSFRALTARIDKEFRLDHPVPDTDFDRTIQGKIVVLSPVYNNKFGVIRRFLEDVSRGGDVLLKCSPLQYTIPGYGVSNDISLGVDGMLLPNVVTAEGQDCLGIHPSRCFVWDVAPEFPYNAPDELALGMARTALLTIERHPALTVFVVTDGITGHNFMQSMRNNGAAALHLSQRANA